MSGIILGTRQNQRQRAGPKTSCQLLRNRRKGFHAAFRHFVAGDVYDDWIVRRTPFDFENLCDGMRFESICSQAINRFRRQRDDFTGCEAVPPRDFTAAEKSAGVCVDKTSAVTHYS
jgi:hypothetical protein